MKLPLNKKKSFGGKMYRGGDEIPAVLAEKMGIKDAPEFDWHDDIKPKDKKQKQKEGE